MGSRPAARRSWDPAEADRAPAKKQVRRQDKVLAKASMLPSPSPPNGFAVQLPAHPLTGSPKPPRVAARIHRPLTGVGRAGRTAAGSTPVGGTAASAC